MPGDSRNNVLDVAVGLDFHELGDLNRPVIADSSKVIPRQVHQHNMFRSLLLILQQFGREGSIPSWVARERPCSSDRKSLDRSSSLPRQHFRTGTNYLSVSK